jgi:hypothetical protein
MSAVTADGGIPDYRDPSLPIDERVSSPSTS